MTENLRQQVARLRDLSPKLNRVTDDAGRVVQAVEKFLNEECSIGIPGRVCFEKCDHDNGWEERSYLEYDRFEGKFRLSVRETTLEMGGLDHEKKTAWASCPRDLKLKSFQAVPQLLAELCVQVERAIQETEGASKTISELLQAFGVPKKETK